MYGAILAVIAVATSAVGSEYCCPTGELQKKARKADIAVDGFADVRVSQTECPIFNGAMIETKTTVVKRT